MLTPQAIALIVLALALLIAMMRARALARRLDRLSESYWQLRYESGQLRARVTRLETTAGLRDPEPGPEAPRPAAATSFIPLSSLKK